tara:strand:- start:4629 stop:4994 length:366 start_codon:yes stop_codon:yes gene_type:complete
MKNHDKDAQRYDAFSGTTGVPTRNVPIIEPQSIQAQYSTQPAPILSRAGNLLGNFFGFGKTVQKPAITGVNYSVQRMQSEVILGNFQAARAGGPAPAWTYEPGAQMPEGFDTQGNPAYEVQ